MMMEWFTAMGHKKSHSAEQSWVGKRRCLEGYLTGLRPRKVIDI